MGYFQGLKAHYERQEEQLFVTYRRFFKKHRIKKLKLPSQDGWHECSHEQLLSHAHALLEDHHCREREYVFGTIDTLLRVAGHDPPKV